MITQFGSRTSDYLMRKLVGYKSLCATAPHLGTHAHIAVDALYLDRVAKCREVDNSQTRLTMTENRAKVTNALIGNIGEDFGLSIRQFQLSLGSNTG